MAVIQKRIGRNGAISYRVMIRRKGFSPVYETHKKLTDARAAATKAENAINEGAGVIVGAARPPHPRRCHQEIHRAVDRQP